ncbi:MAG: hypothetical protein HOL01_18735 [Planctomycetaceae bacterium]|jgi:hypothetical protein|nr:hypothetical protein [Planctomycetaceae bacterium]MBT6487778.1 hypothetical protein [Planctomycetaceae bacterium]MBT6496575.1 hypothetical protein [Planctomycetaceae bacterium]
MADEEREGVRQWAVRIGSVLGALPVLYVLSIGPVTWWEVMYGSFSNEHLESLETFYAPLESLCDWIPGFDIAIIWYIDLWL